MIKPFAIFLTMCVISVATLVADESEENGGASLIEGVEAEKFEGVFKKQYELLGVRKQICKAFGMEDIADDPEAVMAVTMRGPRFYRMDDTQNVIGILTIGFVGYLKIEFKGDEKINHSFIESWSGGDKSFDTFGECHSYVTDEMMKLLESHPEKGEQDKAQQNAVE